MSKTGAWLLDMQEAMDDLMMGSNVDQARAEFLKRYPGQEQFFENYVAERNGEDRSHPGEP
jgi:hypothetical protein